MKIIVLDAGHGGYDYGAVNGERREKDDNLRLARVVAANLRARGQRVIMTRDSDVFVSLEERSNISNMSNADIFVSLHRNSSVLPTLNGTENFVQIGSPPVNHRYAEVVLQKVVNVGVQLNRGVSEDDFYVLRETEAPAQLLEMGFISNECDNIMFDENFYAYAAAISNGIMEALGLSGAGSDHDCVLKIKCIQESLNKLYDACLEVDGVYGPATRRAMVKALQTELNRLFDAGLVVDGIFGEKTKAAVPSLKVGARGNIVFLLMLFLKGCESDMDGIFGPNTELAVMEFQREQGLVPDGIAGPETFGAIFARDGIC